MNISSQNAASDCININGMEWDLLTALLHARTLPKPRRKQHLGGETGVCVCEGYESSLRATTDPQKHPHRAQQEGQRLSHDGSSIRSN